MSEGQTWPWGALCDLMCTFIPLLLCSVGHSGLGLPKDSPHGCCSECALRVLPLSTVLHAPSRVDTVNNSSHEKWTRPWTSPAGSPSGSPQKRNCQHCKHSRLHGRHWLFLTNYLCQSRFAVRVQEQGIHLTTITKTVRMKTGRPS